MKHSDKTLLYVVGGVAAVGGLCVACLAAVILFPARLWTHGGAAEAAKHFLSSSAVVRAKVGTIKDFGLFPSGSVKVNNGVGSAHLIFSLKGDKGEGRAVLDLEKPPNGDWKVEGATLYLGGQAFSLEGKGASDDEQPAPKDTAPPDVPAGGHTQDTAAVDA